VPYFAVPQGRVWNVLSTGLKRRTGLILLVVLLMLAQTTAGLLAPLLLKTLFDTAIPARVGRLIAGLLVGLVAAPTLALGLATLQEYLSIYLGILAGQMLHLDLFEYLVRASITNIERIKTGDIVYRMTRAAHHIGRTDCRFVDIFYSLYSPHLQRV
jgi:ABC-type bacteriocin/lantibiotic exporter with double-glycine peptidase domain